MTGDLPPNHHADHPGFKGVLGYLGAFSMLAGRSGDARLVADMAHLGTDAPPAGTVGEPCVLDLGCGPGTAVRMAARLGANAIGVDPSAPMINTARILTRLRTPTSSVRWILGGAEQLELADESVSVCWSLASVHHWPDLQGALSEIRRVLRPGGSFIALERLTDPGASGLASHGWTDDQAHQFAQMMTDHGFSDATVASHSGRRRRVVTVQGHKQAVNAERIVTE